MPRAKLEPQPTDCGVCEHFGYVQLSPGRWYPCPACRGSGRIDQLGSADSAVCVRDSTIDPDAWPSGLRQRAADARRTRKRDRERARARARRQAKEQP
jgi:hypothetical protein